MWAFNVVRELYRKAAWSVVPERVPQTDKEMIQSANANAYDRKPNQIAVVKIHGRVDLPPYPAKFIVPIRDPRDALVSYMRFTDTSFEEGLAAAAVWTATCDHYFEFPDSEYLRIDYTRIGEDSRTLVGEMDSFLGLELSSSVLDDVDNTFRKENVKLRIETIETDYQQRRVSGEIASDEIVGDAETGQGRVFDVGSGFQSGHVSDYTDGDWASILPAEQTSKLNDVLGDWLTRNGFSLHTKHANGPEIRIQPPPQTQPHQTKRTLPTSGAT